MKIKLIGVGKTDNKQLQQLYDQYEKRISHYNQIQSEFINLKNKPKETVQLKKKEGELLLSRIKKNSQLVLLDEEGVIHSSNGFSDFVQKQINSGTQELAFFIGGAYGFSNDVYKRADFKISLSRMTFTHEMVRIFFIEQLYRAFTIMKGQKYHH